MAAESMSNSAWFEVQGQSGSDDTWHAIYHLASRSELDWTFDYIWDNLDLPQHASFVDFRKAYPTTVAPPKETTVWAPKTRRRRTSA